MEIDVDDYESEAARKILSRMLDAGKPAVCACKDLYERTVGIFEQMKDIPRDRHGIIMKPEIVEMAMAAKMDLERYAAQNGLKDDMDVAGMMKDIDSKVDGLAAEQAEKMRKLFYNGGNTHDESVENAEKYFAGIAREGRSVKKMRETKEVYLRLANALDI